MPPLTPRLGAKGTHRGSWLKYRSKSYVASRPSVYDPQNVARATLQRVRSTPDLDVKLRVRLREAVDAFEQGNAERFGKRLGYENGGYIRQCLRDDDPRPVRASLISKMNDDPEMRGWFDHLMPPLVAADVRESVEPRRDLWPFKRLSRQEWEQLGPLQAVVEDVAVTKARELLQELGTTRKSTSRKAA